MTKLSSPVTQKEKTETTYTKKQLNEYVLFIYIKNKNMFNVK